jgi:hypothetical protein
LPKDENYKDYCVLKNNQLLEPALNQLTAEGGIMLFSCDYQPSDLIALFGIKEKGRWQRISYFSEAGVGSDVSEGLKLTKAHLQRLTERVLQP